KSCAAVKCTPGPKFTPTIVAPVKFAPVTLAGEKSKEALVRSELEKLALVRLKRRIAFWRSCPGVFQLDKSIPGPGVIPAVPGTMRPRELGMPASARTETGSRHATGKRQRRPATRGRARRTAHLKSEPTARRIHRERRRFQAASFDSGMRTQRLLISPVPI